MSTIDNNQNQYQYPIIYARKYNSNTDNNRAYSGFLENRDTDPRIDQNDHPDWLFYYDLDYTDPVMEKDTRYDFTKGYNLLYPNGDIKTFTPYYDVPIKMWDIHGGAYYVPIPGNMIKSDVYGNKPYYDITDIADNYKEYALNIISPYTKFRNLDMVNNAFNNAIASGVGLTRVAPALWSVIKPGTTGGNIIGDIAGWEAANQLSELTTGATPGGHVRNTISTIFPLLGKTLESNPYLSTPYELITEAGFNPMSYRTIRNAALKGSYALENSLNNLVNSIKQTDPKGFSILNIRNLESNRDASRMLELVIPKAEQIKSANTITLDDDGRIIPLSKRDDFSNPDIRYNIDNLPKLEGTHGFFSADDITMPDRSSYIIQKYNTPVEDPTGLLPSYVGTWLPKLLHSTVRYLDNIVLPKIKSEVPNYRLPEDFLYDIKFGNTSTPNITGEHYITGDNYYYGSLENPSTFMDSYIHEVVSHGTDNILDIINAPFYQEYKKFTPTSNDLSSVLKDNYYNDSSLAYEMRATINEARYGMYRGLERAGMKPTLEAINAALDKWTDDLLMSYIYRQSGYGKDYYNYYKMAPKELAKKLVDGIRNAIKTLPAMTGVTLGLSNNFSEDYE